MSVTFVFSQNVLENRSVYDTKCTERKGSNASRVVTKSSSPFNGPKVSDPFLSSPLMVEKDPGSEILCLKYPKMKDSV
jgi:hypothetical protein